MKNKLWIFGDSYSAPYPQISKYGDVYIKWKGYQPKVYGDVLGDKLGMSVINSAVGGTDNYSIFESFCNSVTEMKKGDAVVIGWSDTVRFRIVGDYNNRWKSILVNENYVNPIFKHVSKSSIDEIGVNRMHDLYWLEVISWSNLIRFTLNTNGIDVLFFTPFRTSYHIVPIEWHIKQLETIREETKGDIEDWHHSEEGNRILGVMLYDMMLNKSKGKRKII